MIIRRHIIRNEDGQRVICGGPGTCDECFEQVQRYTALVREQFRKEQREMQAKEVDNVEEKEKT